MSKSVSWVIIAILLFLVYAQADNYHHCFPSLFSFGDSKADTGNVQANAPFQSLAESPPYGRTFFGRPSDRFCDGRLAIDFQAHAYGFPFLSPYLRGLGSDFRHGANFASSGSGALPNLTTEYDLNRQFQQFKKLKDNYLELLSQGHTLTPANQYFGEGLYVISIGENDYRTSLNLGLTVEEIQAQTVPRVIEVINSTVKNLYEEGARKFLVVGIAADGCIPLFLTLLPSAPEDLDSLGCIKSVNDYVRYHNEMLVQAVKQLREEYKGKAELGYGDYYGINVEILEKAESYGFEETHKACCGVGGNYNFNTKVLCGQQGRVGGLEVRAQSCQDPTKFVHWDGIHLTEHFYHVVAEAFLQGRFVDNPPSCTTT